MNTIKNTNAMTKFKITLATAIIGLALSGNAAANSTIVTDAVGTPELWEFEERLGVQKLVSKTNQIDGKGITQTWDANGNKLSRTDAEGRTTTYTYNTTNQRTSMTEASGTPEARTTTYEYVNADIDLVTRTTSPSIFGNSNKEVITTYDDNLNVTAITINGFDAQGAPVTRSSTFDHDSFGKVTQIDGPRTDVNDITTIEYYDCTSGQQCGQLSSVTNALGHTTTYDRYDNAARLLESTDPNGVETTYVYHPRGWMLSMTQSPPQGEGRVTLYEYDNVGQMTKTTLPDGTEQNYVYNAAHELVEMSDNLGNKIEYAYDAKGNRTQEQVFDPDGTLVRNTLTTYDIRNYVESINNGGSITQLINDAVGNTAEQTDPNENPTTDHSFDSLDRLTTTIDALTNTSAYQYNVADQLTQVTAPNGATTVYEYDDLGNQTKETSPDRGTLTYTHDDAGNTTSITDARGITRTYQYDVLNRMVSVTYPDTSENITYTYDAASCGFQMGRLCEVNDETGQTNYTYDAWGNVLSQVKMELSKSYTTSYEYDAQNRVVKMTYPNGRVVDTVRDAIGRVLSVTTAINGVTADVITNRSYRADGLVTGQTLGNSEQESRTYDLQGRVTQITLGSLESWSYNYDANGNVLEIDKPAEGRSYTYDVLDRVRLDRKGQPSDTIANQSYIYDANGNRLRRNGLRYQYLENTNLLSNQGNLTYTRDAVGNTLNYHGGRTFSYSDSNRLRSVTAAGNLRATYRYNANGQRTRKEIPNKNSQVFHYDLAGNLIMRSTHRSNPLEDYIWVDGQLLQFTTLRGRNSGTVRSERVKTFITNDHLSTPRIGTNNNSLITWRWDSDAFGIKRPVTDPDGDSVKVNLRLGFPGQYYDGESGLYYNWNRYYDRLSGRYVTSDPIGLRGGMNTYGYVYGNPLMYSDFYGLQVDINYIQPGSGDPLRGRLNRVDAPEGSLSVGGHGNSEGVYRGKYGLDDWLSPSDVARDLRDLPNYSPDKPVYLYVCDAGDGEDSFADLLSDLLGGQPVYARPDTIYVDRNGRTTPPTTDWPKH